MQNNNQETIVQMEELSDDPLSENKNVTEITEEDLEDDLVLPQMNVSAPTPTADANHLIPDDQYLNYLQEIMSEIREDRQQVSDYVDNFADMIINNGDASTSSKEAFVNLVKIKTDMQDKALKVADLMTRLKMKNTYAYSGPHLNAMQQNNINIGVDNGDFNRKELIRVINQAKKKKKD